MTQYKGELIDKGRRIYLDHNDKEYISVTTLLSHYEDKTHLNNWSQRIGEDEANRIRDEAALRGKNTHSQIETYFNNKHSNNDEVVEFNKYATAAVEKFYSRVQPVKEEGVLLWEPFHNIRVGGRFDQLLYLPPNTFTYCGTDEYVLPGNVIVDLKTKDKQPRLDKLDFIVKHLLQIATYAKMLNATEQIEVKGGCIVYAVALKTKSCCKILHIDKECIDFYWSKVVDMLLDFYGVQSMKQTWRDIIREACYTYDFITNDFISYEPREIC